MLKIICALLCCAPPRYASFQYPPVVNMSEFDDVLDSEHTMTYLTNDNGHHTISQIFHKEITNMRPDVSQLD